MPLIERSRDVWPVGKIFVAFVIISCYALRIFHRLDPKDQKKIKRLGTSLNNIHNTAAMFKVMPGVLGGIGAVLLILMIIFDDEIFYFIFGFLGGFLLLASFMMYGVFHNIEEKERKRVSDQVRSIVLPYNIQQVFHKNENMNQKAEIQTVNSDKWSKEDNAEEDNIIYLSNMW